jgi:hypothetical protein
MLPIRSRTCGAIATYGFNAAELAVGKVLADALQPAITGLAGSMGDADRFTDEQERALKAARNTYAQFRQIARAAFPSRSDRTTLGLTGNVPEGSSSFLTATPASYADLKSYMQELKAPPKEPSEANPPCSPSWDVSQRRMGNEISTDQACLFWLRL